MKHWFVAICAISAGACTTHMETRPSASSAAGGVVGAPYALPIVRHELTVTRTLVGCTLDATGAISALEFQVKVGHLPRYVPGERFVVDYRALGNWHKTSGFKLATFPNHTLKSVNAEADDRSPEIIGATVKTALVLARTMTGVPAARATAGILADIDKSDLQAGTRKQLHELLDAIRQAQLPRCPSDIEQLTVANDALEMKTRELLAQTRKLDALIVPALAGFATETQKQEVQELRRSLLALGDQQAALRRQYDLLAGRLSFVETASFTPAAGITEQTHVFDFPSRRRQLEVRQLEQLRTLFGVPDAALPHALLTLLRESATLSASLDVVSGGADSSCLQAGLEMDCAAPLQPDWGSERPKAIPGIAFRSPANARLRVCKDHRPDVCSSGAAHPMLLDETVSVPQLGRLVILPFRNGFGANNRIEVVFREDGSLDWLSYDAKETSGEHLATLLGGSADQIQAYRADRREREKLEREEAKSGPLQALDHQIALLKKQQELAELAAALDPGQATQRQEVVRLQAEVARLTALRQIRELDAALDGPGL